MNDELFLDGWNELVTESKLIADEIKFVVNNFNARQVEIKQTNLTWSRVYQHNGVTEAWLERQQFNNRFFLLTLFKQQNNPIAIILRIFLNNFVKYRESNWERIS